MYKLILQIITLFCIAKIISCQMEQEDDKLLLSPVELIDLVREEHPNNGIASTLSHVEPETSQANSEDRSKTQLGRNDICKDDDVLRSRKVWSRWSKWGGCSVTCGGGTISRHRFCVAGRCAPGEREEQRRPCALTPCFTTDGNITDELRETE